MGQLFRLKRWLTLADASRHLSTILGDKVTESDVLRMSLDNGLRLSVNFVNPVDLRPGKLVPKEQARLETPSPEEMKKIQQFNAAYPDMQINTDEPPLMVCGAILDESTVFEYSGEEITRRGIFDLVMIGDNVISIEKWAKLLAKDTTAELVFSTIDIVEDTDGVKYHVLESGGPLPKEGGYLPDDVLIGVRPEALLAFEKLATGTPDRSEKPLQKTERDTLLTIIAAFCKYESLDPQGRGAATEIMRMTDDLGAHVDAGTIRRWLAQIPDALERRMK